MATFVLVHGGWHGGWCWSRVTEALRRLGHSVHAPTLTGCGERSHLVSPLIDLTTHVDDVANLLRWERLEDVVLCGHSYAGMVITGVADREAARLRRLVYLDAVVPRDGESMLDQLEPEQQAALVMDAVRNGDGYRLQPPPAELFGIERPDDLNWVRPLLTAHPLRSCVEPLRLAHPASETPKTFIHALKGNLAGQRDKVVGRPDWRITEIDSAHDVMVNVPEELAELLVREAAN